MDFQDDALDVFIDQTSPKSQFKLKRIDTVPAHVCHHDLDPPTFRALNIAVQSPNKSRFDENQELYEDEQLSIFTRRAHEEILNNEVSRATPEQQEHERSRSDLDVLFRHLNREIKQVNQDLMKMTVLYYPNNATEARLHR